MNNTFKFLAVFLITTWVLSAMRSPSPLQEYKNKSFEAKIAAKSLVQRQLKNPNNASFYDVVVFSVGTNIYRVNGKVQSTNGFGAQIRRPFSVTVKFNPDTKEWELQ